VDLSKIKDPQLDFIGQDSHQKAPVCIRREGIIKTFIKITNHQACSKSEM
jgi:hypothetical protein